MKKKILHRLVSYWKRHRLQMLIGLACIFIGNAIGITAPMVIREAINDLLTEVSRSKLLRYSSLVIGIALMQGIFLFLQRRVLVGMSRDIEYEMRNDFFAHLLRLDPEFYHEHRTGDLISRATNDLNAVRMMAGPAIMYSASTVAIFCLALPLMVRVSGTLTLLALLTMPLVSGATKVFGARIHDRFERIQEDFAALSAKAQENFSGVRVVRAYVQEEAEREAFRQLNREYVRRNMSLIKLSGLFYPTLRGLIGLAVASVLWYGGILTMRQQISVGQFVEFNLYLVRLIWPVIALGWVVNLFQRGMASMGRISQILEREPLGRDAAAVSPLVMGSEREGLVSCGPHLADGDSFSADKLLQPSLPRANDHRAEIREGRIEFRDLTFSFDDDRPVLKKINLTIEPGETLAIVGRTGSGKTTLVNLIVRLNDPPPETLFIDGHDVRSIPLEHLRASIGMVPQEPFLFSMSLRENIAFGVSEPADGEVAEAASEAGLDEDAQDFPDGFETLVGERGITLSGGQKQRTAIARALIRKPKILILDDALSSVDTQTEERILHHLRRVMRERTSIIISHRISTVKDAEKIVVLENGEIVEEGTHEDLLALGGLYADLYEKQLLEDELAASE